MVDAAYLYCFISNSIYVHQKTIMGKTPGVYLGLVNFYFCIIFKRAFFGIVTLIASNILVLFVIDRHLVNIIKAFCFLSILMIYFVDYKNELALLKILHIPVKSQKLVKLGIIVSFGLIQWLLFILLKNDKTG
jgi:hypothetical protein